MSQGTVILALDSPTPFSLPGGLDSIAGGWCLMKVGAVLKSLYFALVPLLH